MHRFITTFVSMSLCVRVCSYIDGSISDGWTGDSGHMGNVPVASFDPLFFLHHW